MAVRDAAGRLGRGGFVERHELWTDAQFAAALQIQRVVDTQGIDLVRVSFPDQHGILRGKTLTTAAFGDALESGCNAPSTLVLKDTSHRTAYPVFRPHSVSGVPQLTGVADLVLVPDPTTFRVLPWARRTGWVLCDIYFPDGTPVPFSTRELYRRMLAELAERGYDHVVGLEVEFHVFRLDDPRMGIADTDNPASRRRSPRSRRATSCSPTISSTAWTTSSSCSAPASPHSTCRCARSSSSSGRARSKSTFSRCRALRRPTAWCSSAAP